MYVCIKMMGSLGLKKHTEDDDDDEDEEIPVSITNNGTNLSA